jgi:glutamyl-tRNA synthetase
MKNSQKKLSKREGDPSFDDLLNMGYVKEAVLNYIALLGWNPKSEKEIFSLEELTQAFDVKGLQKAPGIFDMKKLNWFNSQYLQSFSLEEFNKRAEMFYPEAIKNGPWDLMKIADILKKRTEVLSEISESIDFIPALPDYDIALYENEKMKSTYESSLIVLKKTLEKMDSEKWHLDSIKAMFDEIIAELGYTKGQVLWPARIAVSGKQFTPGGAFEIAEILGYEETKKRLEQGIGKIEAKA